MNKVFILVSVIGMCSAHILPILSGGLSSISGTIGGAAGGAQGGIGQATCGATQAASTIGEAAGNLINEDIKFKTGLAQGTLNAGSDILAAKSAFVGKVANAAEGAVSGGLGGVTNATGAVGGAVGDLINDEIRIKSGLAQSALGGVQDLLKAKGDFVGQAGAAVGDAVNKGVSGIGQTAGTIGGAVGDLINKDIKFKTGLAQGALNAGSDILAAKGAFIGNLANTAEGAVSGGLGGLNNATGGIAGAVGNLINNDIKLKAGLAQDVLNAGSGILAAKSALVGKLGDAAQGAVQKGTDAAIQGIGGVTGAVGGLINKDIQFKTNLIQGGLNATSGLIGKLGGGIQKVGGMFGKALGGLTGGAGGAAGGAGGAAGGAGGIGGGFVLPTIGFGFK